MRMIYLDPITNDNAFVDKEHPFFGFGNKITEELTVRTNFSFNFLAEFSKIPIQQKRVIDELINEGLYDLLQLSNGYDAMQKILVRYSASRKDHNSGVKHLQKKNRLVGWISD